jgi:hypothetical protein
MIRPDDSLTPVAGVSLFWISRVVVMTTREECTLLVFFQPAVAILSKEPVTPWLLHDALVNV